MSDSEFVCAICERPVSLEWNRLNGPDRIVPPVCRYCEKTFTKGSHGGRAPEAGAFMDRRKAVQIFALAEALHTAAAHQRWSRRHARA